jgi:hypothetical protein
MSMSETYETLRQVTSRDTPNATSSQASVAGPSRSDSLGLQMPLFGLDLVPASPSASPDEEEGPTTHVTSGPSSTVSLRSAALQSSLESRLRAALDGSGSPEYALTWKVWAMESQLPICALRASVRRTSDNDSGGWPTPNWHDGSREAPDLHSTQGTNLSRDAVLWTAGWPTPDTANVNDGTPYEVQKRQLLDRRERVRQQQQEGTMTPGSGRSMALQMAAQAAGWTTPTKDDVGNRNKPYAQGGYPLSYQAKGAGSGTTQSSSPVSTGRSGVLNPELPRWLIGFPAEWSNYAPTVTRSSRRSRKSS